MIEKHAAIWMEKTPSNAFCFDLFLDQFDNAKVIHTLRNPLDTIASLHARGFNVYYATGIYLLNTSAALANRNHDGYIETKYEDLVHSPQQEVKRLCDYLQIEYNSQFLQSQSEKVVNSQLPGWQHDETQAIGKNSIGRFEKLNAQIQVEIIQAIHSLKISDGGKKFFRCQHETIAELCKELNYDIPAKSHINHRFQLLKAKDQFTRIVRLYPTALHYPIAVT
jgi:hypothetical protein